MTGVKSDSISEKTTERSVLRFFSPLIATMYTKDDWGNLEEYGEEVFPAELCSYETEILKRIAAVSYTHLDVYKRQVQSGFFVPFMVLAKVLPHKQQFLSGMAHHKSISGFQIGKFIHRITRHFVDHRAF